MKDPRYLAAKLARDLGVEVPFGGIFALSSEVTWYPIVQELADRVVELEAKMKTIENIYHGATGGYLS